MNALRSMLDRCGAALIRHRPRDLPTWMVILTLALGMAVLAAAQTAERGVIRGAVAPEHRSLHIVGRPPINESAALTEPAPMSLADFAAWRDDPAISPLALAERTIAIIAPDNSAHRATLWRVTPDLPAMLGIADPIAGRLPEPTPPNAPIELALSSEAAKRWLAGHEPALNQPIRLDGAPAIIVGVLREPPGDAFAGIDAWTVFDPIDSLAFSLALDPDAPIDDSPTLIGITDRSAPHPQQAGTRDSHTEQPVVAPLASVVLGSRIPIALRAATTAATLLFAASLAAAAMLHAGSLIARREELALRLALGTTRIALLAELIIHAAILCLLASAIALLGAWWLIDAVRQGLLGTLPGAAGITLHALNTPWTLAVPLIAAATLAMTCVPIARKIEPAWCVRGLPGIRRTRWNRLDDAGVVLHAALASASIAMALILGSLANRAAAPPPGLSVDRVGIVTIDLPWWRMEDETERWRVVRQTLDAVEGLQQCEAVAAADNAPIVGPDFRAIAVAAAANGQSSDAAAPIVIARLRSATPNAASLLGIDELQRLTEQAASTLLRFSDTTFPPLPATISRSLAGELFGDSTNPLGQPIELGEQRIPALVLAILDDAGDGPDTFDPGGPSIWLPMPIGWESPHWSLLIRLPPDAGEPQRAEAESAIHTAILGVIGDAAIEPIVWLDRRVAERARIYTVSGAMAGAAAGLALVLAILAGIARTRLTIAARLDELRLRSAYGQRAWPLAMLAAAPAMIGIVLGVVLAAAAAPSLSERLSLPTAGLPAEAAWLWAGAIVLMACAAGSLISARFARIDAEALLRSL